MRFSIDAKYALSPFLIAVTAFFFATSCGTGNEDSSGLSGSIEIDGSSTVFPISVAVGEEFRNENKRVRVNVAISGTGGGFERFIRGETAISNASRPIRDLEAAVAAENGIEYTELKVAGDGLSVVVSKKNDFVTCLTTDELRRLWEPGSEITTWNQLRSEFPDEDVDLYGPDADSGTFDYFTQEILDTDGAIRQDYTPNADDNVLVQGIQGSRYSLGYFGYAYYIENTDKLNVLAVDNGNGCIAPEPATINNGTYEPLSRPLFIYVNDESLRQPHVREFVRFYLENAGNFAARVGYVALPDSDYATGKATVAAVAGS